MTARDLMRRDVKSVEPEMSVWSALAMMRQEGLGHLFVTEDDQMRGVLSHRDYRRILQWAKPDGTIQEIFRVSVAQIMTSRERLVVVGPETPLEDVADLVLKQRVACIPVVDLLNRPLGVITRHAVLSALLAIVRERRVG